MSHERRRVPDRTDRDHYQPDAEEPEENSQGRPANPVKQAHDPDVLLAGAFEKDRPNQVDQDVDEEGEEGAGEKGKDEVGRVQQRTKGGDEETPADQRRGIGGDQSQKTDSLPNDAEAPAAQHFEKNQDEREGKENRLPE